MSVLASENATANEVARVLSSDQALAGKVLKLVNSSYYGMPTEVTTVSRAVVVLGFTGVRNLALSFGSLETLRALSTSIDMHMFWSHSLATGAAAVYDRNAGLMVCQCSFDIRTTQKCKT